jgi:hypothetical protein
MIKTDERAMMTVARLHGVGDIRVSDEPPAGSETPF